MKIALFDPYGGKFTQDMQEWWATHGYEVRYNRYYNPQMVEWADVVWFDTCDNNLTSATQPGRAILDDAANYSPWDMHDMDLTGKKIIVRPIDIEVWQGHHQASLWDLVDDVITIAPHIAKELNEMPRLTDKTKFHTIPCGVNLDRFSFAERGPGKDIAIVSEKWSSKGTHLNLQVILALTRLDPTYRFHWLGQRSDSPWEYAYFDEFVEYHKLPIEFTNILFEGQSVDEFLEGKNYLLHSSHKEAFCYANAEAMAKGIKPVLHRFYGADDIWPDMTWDTVGEAVKMIDDPLEPYDSNEYRQYLIDHHYTLEDMMQSFEKVIRG